MDASGFHLTPLGGGRALLEPWRGLDVGRPEPLVEEILTRLQRARADRLYYDLSDLALIDPVYFAWLNRLASACRTVNVRMTCIGMKPTAAFALASYLREPPAFDTALGL